MPEAGHETKCSAPNAAHNPARSRLNWRHQAGLGVSESQSRARLSCRPSSEPLLVSNPGVALHPSFILRSCWRYALRGLISAVVLIPVASACSPPAQDPRPLFGSGVLHPPPKPGDSISHSQMCECKTCNPAACCEGPDEDAPPTTCGDSYDFTSNPSCGGLAVKSCASRCTEQVWRVRSGQSCTDKRPASCCQAG